MSDIVSADWLKDNLSKVRVVDASWYMPDDKRDTRKEFEDAGHIPGAVFFDIDGIADHSTSLPHMLPDADAFAREAGAMGIGNDDMVVIYDSMGIFSAPRVWWTFKAFGHGKAAVLDGGLPAWRRPAARWRKVRPSPMRRNSRRGSTRRLFAISSR
jgi:thiosulfate/3-mercaptopyruvate sulfurtransferase